MKKKILISTGGSGGHVIPATILYDHLKEEFDTFMTIDRRGSQFLNIDKYKIEIFDVPKTPKNFFLLPFYIFSITYLIFKSFFLLKKKKIEILISTGGYMSLPICMASKIFDIKLFLFEPNVVLGRSNKIFTKSSTKVFCYSKRIKNFSDRFKSKICLIPPLLRKSFYNIKKNEYSKINDEVKLLIIGGSQGAKLFDTIIQDSIIKISKKYKLKVLHQTTFNNFDNLKNFYLKNNIMYELFDFNEDISNYMSRSNMCITRAGASTLAELVFLNVPHIAIPLPIAKDNHQLENALFYRELGCNWVFNQTEITDAHFTNKLVHIIENKEDYLNKKKNMKNFSYQNTWNNVNRKIITTINEN